MTAANPNGARARIMAESRKARAALLDVLEQYGPLTNVQICERLGCEVQAMRGRLCRMAAEGLIWSELIDGDNSPHMALYHYGPGESTNEKADMKQHTVTKWKSEPIKHEPIHAFFFGIQQ